MNLLSIKFELKKCLSTALLLVVSANISFSQAPTTFWWNDAVFYEVFVRSFKDKNGDGKGDLQGLTSKLDYLNDGDPSTHNDLGVTAIWLMPIMESPSYHGYDVTDYRTVEQDYGSNADFSNFITEAHNRGIKVIIDYVMNHTSSAHPWFTDALNNPTTSTTRDWYTWQDPKPTNTGPWGQQVWHTKSGNNYYGIFWLEMLDLNYNTPAVKTEMFDIARF
jgi:alpha-amylase